MHVACNGNRGGEIHGLPCFQCPCHYYEVIGKDLYVYYGNDQTLGAHLLMKDFVVQSGANPNGLRLRVEPISQNPKSWPKGGTLKIDPSNTSIHYLTCITRAMVQEFNRREKHRIHLLELASRRKGPMSVVYLSPQYNKNFDFGPTRGTRLAKLNPFTYP